MWATFAAVTFGAVIVGRRVEPFRPPGPLIWEGRFAHYEVRIYRKQKENLLFRISSRLPPPLTRLGFHLAGDTPNEGFEIRKDGRHVHHGFGWGFAIAEIGLPTRSEGKIEVVGRDITGDGIPEIAITEWPARWWSVLHVFECGETFREIGTLKSLGLGPELIDLDGDEIPEVITAGVVFYHFPSGSEGELVPKVIWQWRDGRYHAAKRLMAKPAPSAEELEAKARFIRESPEWESSPSGSYIPAELFATALDLMYSGHEELGWQFIERAWNADDSFKERILGSLRSRLNESPYWPELKDRQPSDAY